MWLILFMCFACGVRNSECGSGSVKKCCEKAGVHAKCVNLMCDPNNPPDDFAVYDVFEHPSCERYLTPISACLAVGRDHLACCLQEAKDSDENACFGMCYGRAGENITSIDRYQICLAINLEDIYRCFARGYDEIPSLPTSPRIVTRTRTSAVFAWDPPEKNSHLVFSYYVICKDPRTDSIELSIETQSTNVTLTGLQASRQYTVSVAALGFEGQRRSLQTDPLYFHTIGFAPRVQAYRKQVDLAPQSGSVTLICRQQFYGTIISEVKWQRKNDRGSQVLVTPDPRIRSFNYISSVTDHPSVQNFILHIEPVKQHDFGEYQCIVSNEFGTGSAKINLGVKKLVPPETPPVPPHICCKNLNVRPPCALICGASNEGRLALRGQTFLTNMCEDELKKILRCTTDHVDAGACCLRRELPGECLPLCDGKLRPTNGLTHLCLSYDVIITDCRLEEMRGRPSALTGVKFSPGPVYCSLSWNPSMGAQIYYIFWKDDKKQNSWHKKEIDVNQHETTLPLSTEEVVIFAANLHGYSSAARISPEGGKVLGDWMVNYY